MRYPGDISHFVGTLLEVLVEPGQCCFSFGFLPLLLGPLFLLDRGEFGIDICDQRSSLARLCRSRMSLNQGVEGFAGRIKLSFADLVLRQRKKPRSTVPFFVELSLQLPNLFL
ncbi:hypothetical protein D9M69_702750 [compost metagenome]